MDCDVSFGCWETPSVDCRAYKSLQGLTRAFVEGPSELAIARIREIFKVVGFRALQSLNGSIAPLRSL